MTGTNLLSPTAFQQLRLDGALALLGEEESAALSCVQDDEIARLQAIIDGLCDLSLRDPLTGTANRRHFDSILDRELDRVARSGDVALLLMVDIDHFKQVNDQYGHNAGDTVLQQVANALTGCVRPMDTLARYGGEEFCVILPDTDNEAAHALAEALRHKIAGLNLPNPDSSCAATLSISLGVATSLAGSADTATGLLLKADNALYRAKQRGRNCSVSHVHIAASGD